MTLRGARISAVNLITLFITMTVATEEGNGNDSTLNNSSGTAHPQQKKTKFLS